MKGIIIGLLGCVSLAVCETPAHYSIGNSVWYDYDANGNIIHETTTEGTEWWGDYDANSNLVHERYSNGTEMWYEYDINGHIVHTKSSNGNEWWYEYDENGNRTRHVAGITG